MFVTLAGFSFRRRDPDTSTRIHKSQLPAYFQTEQNEIHFKCNFLPSYSPFGAPLLQNLMKPLIRELINHKWSWATESTRMLPVDIHVQ